MRTGLTRSRVLAIVALGAVMATTADAQTRTRRTRSTTRIPVSKEPVVPDSTVRDSTPAPAPAPAPEPAPVVTRTESTTVYTRVESPVVRRWRYGNGWYIGVGGGAGIPTESINNAYNTGYAIQVPIGYDALYSPLGFRLNLGYTRLDARNSFRNTGTTTAFLPVADPQIYSAIADAKLRIPLTRGWVGPSSGLYAVGGAGVNHFRNYNNTFALSNPEFNDATTPTSTSESLTRFALNAGGGVSWALGAAEVFLESRFVTTFMPHERASYVPIILGLNLY
ncbi:MAG: hypothetical protein ACJ8AD_12165 [Gemmatimonadaceae bacterium]